MRPIVNIKHKIMKIKQLTILLTCFFLQACDLIEYHPYDVHITGERDCNARNIAIIESLYKESESITFAVMGDSQRWYDETLDFVHAINNRTDIDFVIHGGDMSDFGATKEFLWQRDIMNKLNVPYVALLGNHDCLGTGEETFLAIYGESDFSFVAGRTKFVCLNTNALEYDYSKSIPNFNFMENEVVDRGSEFDKTVLCMHAAPFSDVFNNNVSKAFQYYVRQYPGVQFCTVAHDHNVTITDIYNDGIIYYGSTCMRDRCFLLFTIHQDGYDYEAVYY